MTPKGSKRRPRFLWQGMLILLPVMVMAAIALAALVQDRAAAEREARRRAEEQLQQLGDGFDKLMGSRLGEYALGVYGSDGRFWSQQHLIEAALWPGSAWRQELEQKRQAWPRVYAQPEATYAELTRTSGLRPEEFILPGILPGLAFSADGQLAGPTEVAREPQPPAWRLALNAEQREAFKALEDLPPAATNASRADAALQRFLDTTPPAAAGAQAEFLRLQVLLADARAESAVPQWLAFAQSCGGRLDHGVLVFDQAARRGALSESGVPLSNLALATALQCARETGPTEELWTGLVREVGWAPSAFTPMLLELAEPLAQRRPDLLPCLQALRLNWAATERAWEMADAIRQSGRLQGITTTNLWLDFQGARWLCLLQPSRSLEKPNQVTEARLCPKALVEQILRHVVQDDRVALPPYLGLAAELEGEPLNPLPGNSAGLTLAQVQGQLTCPGEATSPQGHEEFESMPSQPHFTLRITLVDRAQLFAAQRRRLWLFGGLVLAAVLTAAIGFAAAYRSFRRQFRLSEMKSNFVSSVSHELRAPIAAVRLMAESLERGKISEPTKQREYFRFIGQECRRLSSLIENVLDFSRIEQHRKQYELEPTDVVALTRQTVKLMATYAEEKGVSLRLQLPEAERTNTKHQTPNTKLQPALDGKAIQQALVNLIDNALKHSPKGEEVLVGLEVPNPDSPAPRSTLHASRSGSRTTAPASPPPSTRKSSSASTASARSCGARPRAWVSA
jgi:signal transduction histidine kinase